MITDSTPTMVPPPTPVMVQMTVSHGKKHKKFNGKMWQQKMLFYLTTLNLARFLQEDAPALKENKTKGKWLPLWKHGSMLISCVTTTS